MLKEIGRRIIPPEVIDRPKGYFPVPAITHLEGKVLDLVRDALPRDAGPRARACSAPEYVDALLADPNGELTPLKGNKLWQLGLLELWLQTPRDLTDRDRHPASPVTAGGRRCPPTPAITSRSWKQPVASTSCQGMRVRRRPRSAAGAGWSSARPSPTCAASSTRCAPRRPARATSASTRATRTCWSAWRPDELFIDPSYTYRLDLHRYRPPARS